MEVTFAPLDDSRSYLVKYQYSRRVDGEAACGGTLIGGPVKQEHRAVRMVYDYTHEVQRVLAYTHEVQRVLAGG